MERRRFLGSSVAGAALVALPAWLRRAFAEDPNACPLERGRGTDAPSGGLEELFEGYRRAQRAGKPLLVLVIPPDASRRWTHGHAFGELLNSGTPRQLAPLALCEVTCARLVDLRRLVAAPLGDQPTFVVVETDAVPARVQAARVPIEARELFFHQADSWEPGHDRTDDGVAPRVARLATALEKPLLGGDDPSVLARRVDQAHAHLGALELGSTELALAAGHAPPPAQTDRAAALVAAAAVRAPQPLAKELWTALGHSIVPRLVNRPPLGARWANEEGCATEVEDLPEDEQATIGCGMGYVPERSQRFLYFYARLRPI
jgi:hypothetical protein